MSKKNPSPYLIPARWQIHLPFSFKDKRTQMSRLTSRNPVIYDIGNMKCSTTGGGGGSNESGLDFFIGSFH